MRFLFTTFEGGGHVAPAITFAARLQARGHEVLFLERDTPWYAAHRDLPEPDFCELEFYSDLPDLERFAEAVRAADAVMVGSYTPDGVEVGRWAKRTASGAELAISAASSMARARTWSCGTTSSTRPMRNASSGRSRRPV